MDDSNENRLGCTVWVVHTVFRDGRLGHPGFDFVGVYATEPEAIAAANEARLRDGTQVQSVRCCAERDVDVDMPHPDALITKVEMLAPDRRQALVDQLRAVVIKWERRTTASDYRPGDYTVEEMLRDVGALLVAEPPTVAPPGDQGGAVDAFFATVHGDIPSRAMVSVAREASADRAPHVIVAVPEQWDAICRDRFVFGCVAAAAFEKYSPLRITKDGFVFERDQSMGPDELKRLGNRLDEEAARAFEMRKAFAQLRPLCRESGHREDDLREWSR